jgi:hypothetical protein
VIARLADLTSKTCDSDEQGLLHPLTHSGEQISKTCYSRPLQFHLRIDAGALPDLNPVNCSGGLGVSTSENLQASSKI